MGHKHSQLDPTIPGQRQKEMAFITKALHLDDDHEASMEEIHQLLTCFRDANLHGDGILAFDEFCQYIHHEPTIFAETVFAFFSSSPPGSNRLAVGLNFAEFLLFCYFYLTMNDHGLIEYLYNILTDKEFNPMIQYLDEDPSHVKNMESNITHMFGHAFAKNEAKLVRLGAVLEYDPALPYDHHAHHVTHQKFHDGMIRNSSLLHPVLALQIDMWNSLVNKSLWKHHKRLGNTLVNKIITIRDHLHDIMGVQQYHEVFHAQKRTNQGYHTEIQTLPTAPPHTEWKVGATGKLRHTIVHAPMQTKEILVPNESVFSRMHNQDMHGHHVIKKHETAVDARGRHHDHVATTHHAIPVAEEHKPYFPHHYTNKDARLDPLRLPPKHSEGDLHSAAAQEEYNNHYGSSRDHTHASHTSSSAMRSQSMYNMGAHAHEGKMADSTSTGTGSANPSHHTAAYEHASMKFAQSESHDEYMKERQRVLDTDK